MFSAKKKDSMQMNCFITANIAQLPLVMLQSKKTCTLRAPITPSYVLAKLQIQLISIFVNHDKKNGKGISWW
jgi:hypothetical protein